MKIFDWIANAVISLAALALVVLVALMGYQVWGRYVLNDTPTWAENLALLLIVLVVLPVSAVGLRENFHLGITFFIDKLHLHWQRYIEIATAMLLGLFGSAMAYYSVDLVTKTWSRKIPLLGIPQGTKYLPLVICGALIVLFMIERLIKLFSTTTSQEQ